ncbi:DBH-like monooxygenase protein 1 homolog isoform X2 [Dreissena polymorpha]|uniref:DOMON domain-containing protein n=1 Tax=Dreissena polymorpha TaxID=45954 RepID=A0A9D4BUU2_DREPO|nr:DBH-like monooxygenase protein 1 homolog isoform X2 [Dreissena polymorpha]KAH3710540.1 hypothetical protein DPMN_070024 [Dreissena polymorpha]
MLFLAVTLLISTSLALGKPVDETSEAFNQSATLDKAGNFVVYWNYNSSHVTFEVHVKTHGYVGFGLSPNGNMFPADVVVGWVKNGHVFFKDMHTIAHAHPVVDKSQDWFLLHGEENDMGTSLRFVRKLDTCDADDRVITNATQRLIYSYHPDDPADEHSLVYHGGERRGAKSVMLLNVNAPPDVISHEDVKVFDLTAGNYEVPSNDTTYMCVGYQMEDIGGKHHMVMFEPLFTPGNEHMVHHFTVQRCPGRHPHLHGARGECFLGFPDGWPACPEVFIGWATGGGPYYFPPHTGYPVGGADDNSFYVMQMHYDNPSMKKGVIDNSGVRIRLTSKLRQHDVGTLIIGHDVTPLQVIPPRESSFVSKGYCADHCLSQTMAGQNTDEFRIISVMQHAHLLATGMKTRHFRNGTELPPIIDDPSYDFYFQEFRPLPDEVVVRKGDSLSVECTYSTIGRTTPAFGGLTTRDEMCEAFIYHYPRLDLNVCESRPDMNTIFNRTFNRNYYDSNSTDSFMYFMKHEFDWSDQTRINQFKADLNSAIYRTGCHGTHTQADARKVFTFHFDERTVVPYIPSKSQCDVTDHAINPNLANIVG